MVKSSIFTVRELQVMNKRILNRKLSQVDSNYLYKFIRPKLREINSIDAELLLNKMKYNQKIKKIEERIKKVILGSLEDVQAIVLYGSVIQTNYTEYNDIDILVVTNKKINPLHQKYKKINEIKKLMNKQSIEADIQIYDKKSVKESYSRNPSLIYQLKDHKIIYGDLRLNDRAKVYRIELKMKLDWSYVDDPRESTEIYRAIRNTLLVRLLLKGIVDNQKLKDYLNDEIGKNLIERLKTNRASKLDKKIALSYLKDLLEKTEKEVDESPWEKIEL